MQIFSSQQVFLKAKSPGNQKKQHLSRPISTRNSVFFFRTWVNCMLTFERETFTVDTDLLKKRSPLHQKRFLSFFKTFTRLWKPRLLWRGKMQFLLEVFQNVIFQDKHFLRFPLRNAFKIFGSKTGTTLTSSSKIPHQKS